MNDNSNTCAVPVRRARTRNGTAAGDRTAAPDASAHPSNARRQSWRWCALLCGLAVVLLGNWVIGLVHDERPAFPLLGQILLALGLGEFLFRAVLFCRYRPQETVSDALLPTCTVIVPAYNEGRMVHKTLMSVLESDYPAEKLQIVAVDDGSVDDTWRWMRRAGREARGRVDAVRMPVNGGKRRALHHGISRGTGEVIVTIDSDSLVERDTIRNLVSPFVRDARVGAVAGCVQVLNRDEGVIPRMLDVSFAYSFEFVRASQSVTRTVLCTPGALAAYRRSAVLPVLDRWMSQTFLGKAARIGEDRAMTNLILRQGYDTLLQTNAVVHTNVPVRHRALSKMFLRWARSNVRETLVTASFIFSRFREGPARGGRAQYSFCALDLLLAPVVLAMLILCPVLQPHKYLLPVVFAAVVSGCVPAMFYAWRRRSAAGAWGLLYGLFWVGSLSWVTPYAMLTASNSAWMTRDRKQQPDRSAAAPVGAGSTVTASGARGPGVA